MHAAAFFIGAPGLSWENGDVCSRWAFSCGVPSPFGPAHSRAVAFPRQHVWAGVGDSQGNARGLPDIWKPSCMWCHQESNRGHKDFQSFALPTELWHHALSASGYKGKAKILIPQIIRGQIVVLASLGGRGRATDVPRACRTRGWHGHERAARHCGTNIGQVRRPACAPEPAYQCEG